MELALYGPGGYYVSGDRSRTGDYYTAPAAHPAFGALLAVQIRQLWDLMGSPSRFHVVEVGAGGCQLAQSFLDYASSLSPAFARALEYAAVDCSVAGTADVRLQPVRGFGLPFRGVEGCVLSNELPDAFPVHRFSIRDGRALEVYVTLEDGRLGGGARRAVHPADRAEADRPRPRAGGRLPRRGQPCAGRLDGRGVSRTGTWPRPNDRLRPRGEGPLLGTAVRRYAPLLLRSHPAGRPRIAAWGDRT